MAIPEVKIDNPTREEWLKAAEALRKGDGVLMADILRRDSLPTELAQLFAMALDAAAQAEATISENKNHEDPKTLMLEARALAQANPASVADAKKIAVRLAEIEPAITKAEVAINRINIAGKQLEGLHSCFAELFGLEPVAWALVLQLPEPLKEWMYERFGRLPSRWRDLARPKEITTKPKRKLRAAGFGGNQ